MPQVFDHQLPSRIEAIGHLLDSLEAWAGRTGLPDRALFRLNLVLEELATNIVAHGYAGQEGTVDVNVVDDGAAVTLTLRDRAAAFDPFAGAPQPDLDGPMETRQAGGLGVHFVKEMAQSYAYRRDAGENEIVVKLARTA
jgi:serine/threonine-protein kinase RsbW